MNLAIETENLTKYYNGRPVVRALNLRIPVGSVYGFLGRNGAGKSTTIKMLTGLTPPDAGSARLLGEEVRTMAPATRARIAYIAEGHPLYGGMTIAEIERFTKSFYSRWSRELFQGIIEHFQLSPTQKVRRLSNGQRAQVSLALAVAPDPELLILDDPTLGLDTVVRREFLESMIEIIQRQGRTILFSTHILGDVERVADRIGVMVDGVLRVDCPTEQFKSSVQKLVLEFDRSPPAFPSLPGVVSDAVYGKRREVAIVHWNDQHQAAAEALSPVSIQLIPLNLEDAFIAYTRGQRPPLPSFEAIRERA